MLDAPNHQGKFGQDYVRVLASAAGVLVFTCDLDRDGVDLNLRSPGRLGRAGSSMIDVQVKSWSTPRCVAGTWRFDGLNEEQFNKLAGSDYLVPRYLFLVIVPPDPREYIEVHPDGIRLRHLGYFQSLQGEPRIARPDRNRRRRVEVPLANVLTVRALQGLIHPDLVATA